MTKNALPVITEEEMERIRIEAMDFAGIGLYRYRGDGTVVFMDHGAMQILDIVDRFPSPKAVIGHNIAELINYMGSPGQLRSEIRKHGHIHNYRYLFETLSGKQRWALHDSYIVKKPDSDEEYFQVIIRDITELVKMQEELDIERERLAVTLRSIGDGVISTDVQGRVVLLNREAEKLTGWTQAEAMGKPLPEVFQIVNEYSRETVPNPVDKVLAEGVVVGLANHTILISRDGTERPIADSGAPIFDRQSQVIGVVLVFRDVAQEREIEDARQRADKLESIGILAGGIAHDFNNYLTGIIGNISLARLDLAGTGNSEIVSLLVDAEKCSQLAKRLTGQLLTFSKGGEPVREPVDLAKLLRSTAGFCLTGSPVELKLELPDDLWPADVDEGQVNQLVDNLVINAKQAMPEGGCLTVTADNVQLGQEEIDDCPAGRYVRIRFADTGPGIAPHYRAKVFDPYFTTKQNGSGIGLTSCYSIAKRHNGYISVDSILGKGTIFTVYLPATESMDDTAPAPEPPDSNRAQVRILLMDDKEFVREICRRQLESLGHDVTCVASGEEAIDVYMQARDEQRPFDLLIFDLTIPGGMGGVPTLAKLKKMDANVRAIAASGYSNDPVMADPEAYGFIKSLYKPFSLDTLASVLASVLPS
jgi:two-component system cell cycle sensor histidine kinase/response regulator CckA